jgi:hypothetical protein
LHFLSNIDFCQPLSILLSTPISLSNSETTNFRTQIQADYIIARKPDFVTKDNEDKDTAAGASESAPSGAGRIVSSGREPVIEKWKLD